MASSRLYRRDSIGGYEEERFQNEVDNELLCPICLKVLKDPVQCGNEHYFCRSCIKKHLRENSETCPMCKHHLTETTLTKPPRILMLMLLGLKIRCDYAKRGCRELIKLEFLDHHVENCGYSPTRCTNPGCSEVINQRYKERHESKLCRFRKIVCNECELEMIWQSSRVHPCFLRKDMDELSRKLNVVMKDTANIQNDVKQMKLTQETFIKEVRNVMERQAANQEDENRRMSDEMKKMRAEMACLTKKAIERSNWFTRKQRVFVCGGRNDTYILRSVESFSWTKNSWKLESAMKEARSGASAFVHERKIFVAGGWTGTKYTDSIESLNVDKEPVEWIELPVKMPIKWSGHKTICHENTAILTGGCDGEIVSDGVYVIQLNPPYATKLSAQMPEPTCYHGCEIIDNQVILAGGRTSRYLKDAKDTVYVYDINNNECKPIAALPFAISEMATVSYKEYVILIGGVNEKGHTLNTVMMYDIKTGKTKMLPGLNHKRAGGVAVNIGNLILVMGGYVYEAGTCINSVEYFDFITNVWRELSPMETKRTYATAVAL